MSCEAQGGAACDKSQTQIQSPERKRRPGPESFPDTPKTRGDQDN